MTITTEDRVAISDLLARYCWLVDEGDGEGWAALWLSDGRFTGIPEPLHGHDALRGMPPGFHQAFGGRLRHHITNIAIAPGEAPGEAAVRAYSTVDDWREGGRPMAFARLTFRLRRAEDGWRIASLHADMV